MDMLQFILIALGMILVYKLLANSFFTNKDFEKVAMNALLECSQNVIKIEQPYILRLETAINAHNFTEAKIVLQELAVERQEILDLDVLQFEKFRENNKKQ